MSACDAQVLAMGAGKDVPTAVLACDHAEAGTVRAICLPQVVSGNMMGVAGRHNCLIEV